MKSKRIISVLLMVMILSTSLVFAAESYTITGYSVDKTMITKNDSFNLTLNLKKIGTVPADAKLILVNESTNSFLLGTGSASTVIENVDFTKSDIPIRINMTYLGSGKTFAFKIINNNTGEVIIKNSVTIKEVVEASTTDNSPTIDYSKRIPVLVPTEDLFKGEFGTNRLNNVTFSIKNDSMYFAKNVRATIIKGNDSLPFILTESKIRDTVKTISARKEGTFKFDFKINPAALPKVYDFKLKLEYQNAGGNTFTREYPIYMKIENYERAPVVSVIATEIQGGAVSSDQATNVQLTVTNTGTLNANKIDIQLTGFTVDGLRLQNDADTKYIGNMAQGQTGDVNYSLMASPKANGTQMLTAKIKYYDDMGKLYERESQVYIHLPSSSESSSKLSVKFSRPQYYIGENKTITVSATVKNNSKTDIKDIKVNLSAEAGVKFMSPYINIVKVLKAGESKTFNYKLMTASGATENTYPLYVNVKPASAGDDVKIMDITGITVSSGSSGSKPKVIIAGYDYGGEFVYAGKPFPLIVKFKNTSTSLGIKNMKATFKSADSVFIPVDSSNAFFINAIKPGETVEQTVMITTKNDVAPKIYGIDFKIAYEDQNGKSYDEKNNPYVEEESISINLKQQNRLEVSEFKIPETATVGQDIKLDINFFNMGKSTMYNLLIKMEGDFETRDSTQFVGTFEPGKSEYYSGTIVPSKKGEAKGAIIFSYEDANGAKEETKKEITFTAMENTMPEGGEGGQYPGGEYPGGEVPTDPGSGGEGGFSISNIPKWAIFIAGLAVISGIGFVIIRHRNKKRQASLLEAIKDEAE